MRGISKSAPGLERYFMKLNMEQDVAKFYAAVKARVERVRQNYCDTHDYWDGYLDRANGHLTEREKIQREYNVRTASTRYEEWQNVLNLMNEIIPWARQIDLDEEA